MRRMAVGILLALATHADAQQSESVLLVCRVDVGERRLESNFRIDFTTSKVNGWPAEISDGAVVWTQRDEKSSIRYSVNRYTGGIAATQYYVGTALYTGQCSVATEKKF